MKKRLCLFLGAVLLISSFMGVLTVPAATVNEIQKAVDALCVKATEMHAADSKKATYDPVAQHIGDSNFDNECTTLAFYQLLHLGIHKYSPFGSGGTWYSNFPSGETSTKKYTAIKKSGESALKDFVKEYGSEIYHLLVGFSPNHVMFIYAIKDNKCYYTDSFTDGYGNIAKRKEANLDDFIRSYKSYGYTFQGAIYFKPLSAPTPTPVPTPAPTPRAGWSDWGAWQESKITASDTVEVQTSTQYRYYNFTCSSCSFKSPYWGSQYACANCKKINTIGSWAERWELTKWADASSTAFDSAKSYVILGGQRWYFTTPLPGDNASRTVYRSRSLLATATPTPTSTPEPTQEPTEAPTIEPLTEPTASPDMQNVNIVTIVGEKNGIKMTAIGTDVGVSFYYEPNDNPLGYRIFRSTVEGEEGISITDFPLIKLKQWVDVNVESDTTYYYTIREMIEEASFDQSTMELKEEVLGEPSEVLAIKTESILEPIDDDDDSGDGVVEKQKSFIIMKLEEKIMQVGTDYIEIDAAPQNLDGRVLVPIRHAVEAMGGNVAWDEAESKVTIDANKRNVLMWLQEKNILVDGNPSAMDVVPQSIDGRTMLPIRFVAENIGNQIAWIGSEKQIIIVFYK